MYLDLLHNRRGRYVEHWDRLPNREARTMTTTNPLAHTATIDLLVDVFNRLDDEDGPRLLSLSVAETVPPRRRLRHCP
jgi:hypothetical protein